MTQTPESQTELTAVATDRPKLFQVAAWVGIVAGVVFIVAVIRVYIARLGVGYGGGSAVVTASVAALFIAESVQKSCGRALPVD
jgi:hypothetical protein